MSPFDATQPKTMQNDAKIMQNGTIMMQNNAKQRKTLQNYAK